MSLCSTRRTLRRRYLADMMLAARYVSADVLGKTAYFVHASPPAAYVTRWYAMRYDLPVAAYYCLGIGLMLRDGHKRR